MSQSPSFELSLVWRPVQDNPAVLSAWRHSSGRTTPRELVYARQADISRDFGQPLNRQTAGNHVLAAIARQPHTDLRVPGSIGNVLIISESALQTAAGDRPVTIRRGPITQVVPAGR